MPLTEKQRREYNAKIRMGLLPKFCECGGLMVYVMEFGRIFSHCCKCTPVITIKVTR